MVWILSLTTWENTKKGLYSFTKTQRKHNLLFPSWSLTLLLVEWSKNCISPCLWRGHPNNPIFTLILYLHSLTKHQGSHLSLNPSLFFLFFFLFFLHSCSNQPCFPPPSSQALQGLTFLFFEEIKQIHTNPIFQALKERGHLRPLTLPTRQKASSGSDPNSSFLCVFKY